MSNGTIVKQIFFCHFLLHLYLVEQRSIWLEIFIVSTYYYSIFSRKNSSNRWIIDELANSMRYMGKWSFSSILCICLSRERIKLNNSNFFHGDMSCSTYFSKKLSSVHGSSGSRNFPRIHYFWSKLPFLKCLISQ